MEPQILQYGLKTLFSIFTWPAVMIFMPSNIYPSNSKGQLGTGLKAYPKAPLEARKSSKTLFKPIFKELMSDLRTRTI